MTQTLIDLAAAFVVVIAGVLLGLGEFLWAGRKGER